MADTARSRATEHDASAPTPGAHHRRHGKVRWIIISLAFLAIAINYVDRANLSVALPFIQKDFHMSTATSGLVLGAFFWTYAIFQLPMGWLVDRLGPRITFSFSVVWWSVFTAATSLARGTVSLLGLRYLLGVGEAGAYPSATRVTHEWFPRGERGLASGIYDGGARGGTLISIPLVTVLIAALGWRGSFILTGAIGIVWAVVWIWFYRRPQAHKYVSEEETAYIEENSTRLIKVAGSGHNKLRLADIVKSRSIWGMAIGFACQSYVIYFFITWFPSYLIDQLHFSLLALGLFGTIPGIVAFAGDFIGGWTSDKMVSRGISVNIARKTCIVIGMAGSALIGLVGIIHSPVVALVLLSVSFGFVSFATASIVAVPADMAPIDGESSAGTIQGFQNGISNLAGIASPLVIGVLYGATGSFAPGLLSAAAVALAGCLIYIFMVKKIQPFNGDRRSI